MRKIRTQDIIDSILHRAPHSKIRTLAAICYPMEVQSAKTAHLADEHYMRIFEYGHFCEYLTNPNFKVNFPYANPNRLVGPMVTPPAVNNRKKQQPPQRSDAQKKLLNTITILNNLKDTFSAYAEAEEVIATLTAEQSRKHKKYLVYMYKWILNQRKWGNSDIEKLSVELKQMVLDKIYEGHSLGEEQDKVKEQLQRVQQKIKSVIEMEEISKAEKAEKIKSSYEAKTNAQERANEEK